MPTHWAQLERVRFAPEYSGEYDEPQIFTVWAQRSGVEYSLEDEAGLRGGFDECVAAMVRKGEHPKAQPRLLSQQVATGSAAPPIRAPAKDDGGAVDVGGDAWAAVDGCYSEAEPLVGHRLEVWWGTAAAPEGAWQAGYAKSISRSRGLQIEYDDGERETHRDISLATEGDVWRREEGAR